MNRRMRTRMSGGVRGGRLAAALLLDYLKVVDDELPAKSLKERDIDQVWVKLLLR
jgi:hypothetical protein